MTRATLAAVLVSILVFQPIISTAQEISLEERLRDVSAEVERFAASLPEEELVLSQRSDEEDVAVARLRARMRNLPSSTDISVVLRGGERIEGELADATSEEFALWIRRYGTTSVKEHFRYEEVQSSVLPERDGWMPVERISGVESGKKIELLLVDQTTVKGRFSSATSEAVMLDLGEGKTSELHVDEVASVRTLGMSKGAKRAIIAASVAGGIFLLLSAAYYYGQN